MSDEDNDYKVILVGYWYWMYYMSLFGFVLVQSLMLFTITIVYQCLTYRFQQNQSKKRIIEHTNFKGILLLYIIGQDETWVHLDNADIKFLLFILPSSVAITP